MDEFKIPETAVEMAGAFPWLKKNIDDLNREEAMPPFNIDTVYAFEAWEEPGGMIDLTIRTSDGEVQGLITKDEAVDLVARLLEHYPQWKREIGSPQRSMTE